MSNERTKGLESVFLMPICVNRIKEASINLHLTWLFYLPCSIKFGAGGDINKKWEKPENIRKNKHTNRFLKSSGQLVQQP